MTDYSGAINKLQKSGAVLVIPTDTVYGLAARAADQAAVSRLYELKRREGKPGTLIAASTDQLVELGIKKRYLTAVEQFWPGALSVIIPCADPALRYLHQGKMSLAIRIPAQPDLVALLRQTGPLLTSSANHPGESPAVNAIQAQSYFGDQVDSYVDGGDLSDRQPSTIIRIVDDAIEIVRAGAVKIDENGRQQ
jgi:L-threonylcarbamoyladenylate synthase